MTISRAPPFLCAWRGRLFEEAEKAGVPEEGWHDFLKEEFPLPDGADSAELDIAARENISARANGDDAESEKLLLLRCVTGYLYNNIDRTQDL